MWPGIKSDQKLVLVPLCAKDAMVELLRQSQMLKTCDVDDDGVMKEINKLEDNNQDEYRALGIVRR